MSNIDVLEDFFEGLSAFDQRKIFLAGFRKSAKPLVNAAKANAPYGESGDLKKSIGTVDVPGEIALLVGSKSNTPHLVWSKGRFIRSKVWYGWLIEKGSFKTGERHHRAQSLRRGAKQRGSSAGKSTGTLRPTNFFENAYNSVQENMYSTIEQEWHNEIDRYIIKYSKL